MRRSAAPANRPLRFVFASIVVIGLLGVGAPAGAAPEPAPSSMASLGDSITRGFNACGWYVECTSRSWSTGSSGSVQSHYLRLRALNPGLSGRNHNDARTGAQADDLARQAGLAVGQQAEYVTILIGANDACTSSEATMTPTDTFRDQIDAGLAAIKGGLPGARVFVASIPDIYRLWEVGHGRAWVRFVWSQFGICQSMLANPGSGNPADEARRQRVRQRVIDYNAQLAAACATFGPTCDFDGNAVFGYQFTLAEISPWDYFHPDTDGQRVLAEVTYEAGFVWTG
ncbi:MAG: GDSL-type esterase/lipase family protein [Acidimicrobiales bacterium]